jgi:hypothetical protein
MLFNYQKIHHSKKSYTLSIGICFENYLQKVICLVLFLTSLLCLNCLESLTWWFDFKILDLGYFYKKQRYQDNAYSQNREGNDGVYR